MARLATTESPSHYPTTRHLPADTPFAVPTAIPSLGSTAGGMPTSTAAVIPAATPGGSLAANSGRVPTSAEVDALMEQVASGELSADEAIDSLRKRVRG